MKVVFDANTMFRQTSSLGPTGVGQYSINVVRHLAAGSPDWKLLLVAAHLSPVEFDAGALGPNVQLKIVKFSSRAFRKLLKLNAIPPIETFLGRVDAMIGTGYVTWPTRAPRIPVVYDLSYIRFPETLLPATLSYLKATVPRSIKTSTRLITISGSIRDEIASRFDYPPERIDIAPPGCDLQRFSSEAAPVKGVPSEYILFVGTLEPRKNLSRLLASHIAMRAEDPAVPPLVIAGGMGWESSSLKDSLGPLVEAGAVILLGYVSDQDLVGLYSSASAFVMPSLYEGFGMPIIEAMGAGCPVACSDRGAMAETAGGAAKLFDPESPDSIARALLEILGSFDVRQDLIAAGRIRARAFTWEQTAATVKSSIEMAADTGG